MGDSWWDRGEPCEDDGLAFCGRCRPRDLPEHLYMTEGTGSSAFHALRSCRALADGQDFIAKRGGTPAPILAITPKQAASTGKFPCLECLPHLNGRLNG